MSNVQTQMDGRKKYTAFGIFLFFPFINRYETVTVKSIKGSKNYFSLSNCNISNSKRIFFVARQTRQLIPTQGYQHISIYRIITASMLKSSFSSVYDDILNRRTDCFWHLQMSIVIMISILIVILFLLLILLGNTLIRVEQCRNEIMNLYSLQ